MPLRHAAYRVHSASALRLHVACAEGGGAPCLCFFQPPAPAPGSYASDVDMVVVVVMHCSTLLAVWVGGCHVVGSTTRLLCGCPVLTQVNTIT